MSYLYTFCSHCCIYAHLRTIHDGKILCSDRHWRRVSFGKQLLVRGNTAQLSGTRYCVIGNIGNRWWYICGCGCNGRGSIDRTNDCYRKQRAFQCLASIFVVDDNHSNHFDHFIILASRITQIFTCKWKRGWGIGHISGNLDVKNRQDFNNVSIHFFSSKSTKRIVHEAVTLWLSLSYRAFVHAASAHRHRCWHRWFTMCTDAVAPLFNCIMRNTAGQRICWWPPGSHRFSCSTD